MASHVHASTAAIAAVPATTAPPAGASPSPSPGSPSNEGLATSRRPAQTASLPDPLHGTGTAALSVGLPSSHLPPPSAVTPVTAVAAPSSWTEGDPWSAAPLLARGAEATVHAITYMGRPAVYKARTPKAYRHPVLDATLTTRRAAAEVRCLVRARRAGVAVPAVYHVRPGGVVMERVGGVSLRTYLRSLVGGGEAQRAVTANDAAVSAAGAAAAVAAAAAAAVGAALGEAVARLHRAQVVHGDLTPANVMVVAAAAATPPPPHPAHPNETAPAATGDPTPHPASAPALSHGAPPRVVLIDFGLATTSSLDEDKAVDLYVLERAVSSGHPPVTAAVVNRSLLAAYKRGGGAAGKVLARLAEVRLRGRKRVMVG